MENITTPIQEIPVIAEKPKTNFLNLILISLAFILFLTGAYFLGKQSTTIPEISPTPTKSPVAVLPQTTTIPTQSIDLTANWKT
ncbi:MAG: hypothetical protein Q7R95_06505, partial [bacterium]|nr:hypothetical protein [bacterium]